MEMKSAVTKMNKIKWILCGCVAMLGTFNIYHHFQEPEKILFISMGVALLWGTVEDLRKHQIPNQVSAIVMLLSLSYLAIHLELALLHILTAGVIAILLMSSYLLSKKQLGLGDVKLLIVLSILLGPDKSLVMLFYATVLAGAFSLIGLIFKKLNRHSEIPFMPFIFISYYYVILI